KETGTRFQLVPYRGSAPALQDLVVGQIDLMIPTAADSLERVRAGTIKAFAVTAKSLRRRSQISRQWTRPVRPGFTSISGWGCGLRKRRQRMWLLRLTQPPSALFPTRQWAADLRN